MSRPITLGNGRMLVGLDHYGMVSDLYYPHVGLENHVSARRLHHRIGIWVDGDFSWLDDNKWQLSQRFNPEEATGGFKATCDSLKISLETQDFVDHEYDVFARNLHIINHSNQKREIRIFWHQVFEISNSQAGDTAQYRPLDNIISHYKGRRAFTIYAENHRGEPFDSYSVGLYGIEGHEGTYKDAEDGELSNNPVEHGSVDSVIRVVSHVEPLSSARQYYWLAADRRPRHSIRLHHRFKDEGIHKRQQLTARHQKLKLAPSLALAGQLPHRYSEALARSVAIVFNHLDKRGAVLASSDSEMLNYGRDYYHYCWPRDAVYVLYSLMLAGHRKPVYNFLDFCIRTMNPKGYMMHKYMTDGALGSSWQSYIHKGQPELPIQEDETAGVVWLIGKCWQQTHDLELLTKYYEPLIRPMANFMTEYIDESTGLPHASYDLWEEKFLTTTYTTSVVAEALSFAADMAKAMNDNAADEKWRQLGRRLAVKIPEVFWDKKKRYFIKGYYLNQDGHKEIDDTLDSSSFYAIWRYKILSFKDDRLLQAYETLRHNLSSKEGAGGYVRYAKDNYLRSNPDSLGNPWIITTLWVAEYTWKTGDQLLGRELLDWVLDKATETGTLSEQIEPRSGDQVSVSPLIWSHAELIYSIMNFQALGM